MPSAEQMIDACDSHSTRVSLPPRWTRPAIEALFALPFTDLIFRAQQVHREHHAPNAVQLSTLLSIKTGGCPEDCGYCPQAKRYHTTVEDEKLVRRYVAVWHESDAELRRKAVHDLWAEDGAQVLQPPEEMRQAAAGLGFPSLVLRARGHEELEARVTRTYHEFIASGDYTFRSRDNADRLGDVVKFNWEMIPAGGGEVAGAGLEILLLDADGRITTDYQFIEG